MKIKTTSILSIVIGLLLISGVLVFTSNDPQKTLVAFFITPITSWWHFGNMLNMATLLIISALGIVLALKTGMLNLGGEGQIYASALFTSLFLSNFQTANSSQLEILTILVLCALGAAMIGSFLAFIPGLLATRWNISELLSSFLLSAAILPFLDFLVGGPLRDAGKNLLATPIIQKEFILQPLIRPSFLNMSFFIMISLIFLVKILLHFTRLGFAWELTGDAPEFAQFSGFPTRRIKTAGMSVSGFLHGLTGFFAISGTWYQCHQGFSSGMGWSALAIALIAHKKTIALLPAGILYAWIIASSESATLTTRFSFDSSALIQGIIFLLISIQVLPRFKGKKI